MSEASPYTFVTGEDLTTVAETHLRVSGAYLAVADKFAMADEKDASTAVVIGAMAQLAHAHTARAHALLKHGSLFTTD